jgi:hypothetical protein
MAARVAAARVDVRRDGVVWVGFVVVIEVVAAEERVGAEVEVRVERRVARIVGMSRWGGRWAVCRWVRRG